MMIQYKPYGANKWGIPREWPQEMRRVDDNADVPEGFLVMSEEEYVALIERLSPAKEKWNEQWKWCEEQPGFFEGLWNQVFGS